MKLSELLDVIDSQIRIEIIVTYIDAQCSTLTTFNGEAGLVPPSVLRAYGDCDVVEINRPSIDDGGGEYNVKLDRNGILRFSFKNTIQIFI